FLFIRTLPGLLRETQLPSRIYWELKNWWLRMVVLNARSEDKLRGVADEINASGGDVAIAVGDVSKEEDCKKMVDVAVETFGGLHVAFNNAGVFMAALFSEITEDMTSKIFDINLKSLVFCFKYQIPAMAKSGNKGSIIVDS
ncbi:unnamed protein product, partial [Ascophyllum nodosum]